MNPPKVWPKVKQTVGVAALRTGLFLVTQKHNLKQKIDGVLYAPDSCSYCGTEENVNLFVEDKAICDKCWEAAPECMCKECTQSFKCLPGSGVVELCEKCDAQLNAPPEVAATDPVQEPEPKVSFGQKVKQKARSLKDRIMNPFRSAMRAKPSEIRHISRGEKDRCSGLVIFYTFLQGLFFAVLFSFMYYVVHTFFVLHVKDYPLLIPLVGVWYMFKFCAKRAKEYTETVNLYFEQHPNDPEDEPDTHPHT